MSTIVPFRLYFPIIDKREQKRTCDAADNSNSLLIKRTGGKAKMNTDELLSILVFIKRDGLELIKERQLIDDG